MTGGRSRSEVQLRARLGVPVEAEQVVVVTESTHWDPNWLLTSGEYFRFCVRRTLDGALDELLAEPRRVFSLECAFFPDLYWQARPERRATFRKLVNEGRLRFTGSGVTTPDTLLPEDELLLRDLLLGQEWLRTHGMTQEPRVLYLPDSFGHTPALPSLLAAAGVTGAAVCRIDGMRFPGADLESAHNFPRAGSSAAQLIEAGTADFVWRGPDGSEVLTHWMSHSYGHGDMIASGGISRALGLPVSWPDRRPDHVDARIESYLRDLDGLGRTPYRLLAIGFDFVRPVPRLLELLDGWNDRGYPRTGVWLVNAGLDDYLDLVAPHRSALPTLDFDPNPYWMGFYATRPDLKLAARALGRRLITADDAQARGALLGRASTESASDERRATAWWRATTSNHHDYVTGTAPDRVALGEQRRWLDEASAAVATPSAGQPPEGQIVEVAVSDTEDDETRGAPTWHRRGAQVIVESPKLRAVFDEGRGGALVSWRDADGVEQLSGPSFELCSYAESGGLWRMGQELHHGRWKRRDRSGVQRGTLRVEERPDGRLDVHNTVPIDGIMAEVVVSIGPSTSALVVRTTLAPRLRRTVTLAIRQRGSIGELLMHQPGGVVARGLRRFYEPTFWPLHSFAATLPPSDRSADERAESATARGAVVAVAVPTALHADADGTIEVVVARTAVKEVAFGVVPVMAPAWGRKWGVQSAAVAFGWSASGDDAARIAEGRRLRAVVDVAAGLAAPPWLVVSDDPLVEVITVKPADRGDGTIVRLRNWDQSRRTRLVRLSVAEPNLPGIASAWLTDSRERDIAPLATAGGRALVQLATTYATVRLDIGRTATIDSTSDQASVQGAR
jgi:hypothetical protein